jgi:redox-sensing transcriptional repressor
VVQVPPGVALRKVDLSTELQILAYHEQRKNGAALALTAEQAVELAKAVRG